VYLLDRDNFEKESSHKYLEDTYAALVKHELAHVFTQVISKQKGSKPIWLWEGIAIYLSGQNNFKKNPEKLSGFLSFYDGHDKVVYYESGFAVEFLVKKYGKEKLLELIKRLKETNSEDEFAKLFKEIYEVELKYENFGIM